MRGRLLGPLLAGLGSLALGARLGAQAAPPPSSAAAELEAVAALVEKGQLEPAERRLRSVAERFRSVRALLQLSRLQSDRGDHPGALASLDEARAIAPNSEDVLAAHAEAQLATGSLLPAISTLEALTRLAPTGARYHHLRGVALLRAGDPAAAAESLLEAQRLEPDQPETLAALGTALVRGERYAEARTHLLRAASLSPDSVEALASLAEAEQGLGEGEAALDHARRALAREDGHPTANLVVGMLLIEQERYPEARDALEKAAAGDPASAKAEYQLSLVYARLQDEARSRRHRERYQAALEQAEQRVKEVRDWTGFSTGGMQR